MEGNFLLIDFHTYSLDERSMETWHMARRWRMMERGKMNILSSLKLFLSLFSCAWSVRKLFAVACWRHWDGCLGNKSRPKQSFSFYMFVCENNKTKSNENDVFAQLSRELERGWVIIIGKCSCMFILRGRKIKAYEWSQKCCDFIQNLGMAGCFCMSGQRERVVIKTEWNHKLLKEILLVYILSVFLGCFFCFFFWIFSFHFFALVKWDRESVCIRMWKGKMLILINFSIHKRFLAAVLYFLLSQYK